MAFLCGCPCAWIHRSENQGSEKWYRLVFRTDAAPSWSSNESFAFALIGFRSAFKNMTVLFIFDLGAPCSDSKVPCMPQQENLLCVRFPLCHLQIAIVADCCLKSAHDRWEPKTSYGMMTEEKMMKTIRCSNARNTPQYLWSMMKAMLVHLGSVRCRLRENVCMQPPMPYRHECSWPYVRWRDTGLHSEPEQIATGQLAWADHLLSKSARLGTKALLLVYFIHVSSSMLSTWSSRTSCDDRPFWHYWDVLFVLWSPCASRTPAQPERRLYLNATKILWWSSSQKQAGTGMPNAHASYWHCAWAERFNLGGCWHEVAMDCGRIWCQICGKHLYWDRPQPWFWLFGRSVGQDAASLELLECRKSQTWEFQSLPGSKKVTEQKLLLVRLLAIYQQLSKNAPRRIWGESITRIINAFHCMHISICSSIFKTILRWTSRRHGV